MNQPMPSPAFVWYSSLGAGFFTMCPGSNWRQAKFASNFMFNMYVLMMITLQIKKLSWVYCTLLLIWAWFGVVNVWFTLWYKYSHKSDPNFWGEIAADRLNTMHIQCPNKCLLCQICFNKYMAMLKLVIKLLPSIWN